MGKLNALLSSPQTAVIINRYKQPFLRRLCWSAILLAAIAINNKFSPDKIGCGISKQ